MDIVISVKQKAKTIENLRQIFCMMLKKLKFFENGCMIATTVCE